jgi:hypothetical protein
VTNKKFYNDVNWRLVMDLMPHLPPQYEATRSEFRCRSHNTSLSSNGTNKLERYITSGWDGLPGKNTPAYWARSPVTKKMK